MHRGYVKLWRRIKDWGWYKHSPTKDVFIHLLIECNHKPYMFLGHKIERGQVVVGRYKLALELGLSDRCVRTALNHLKSTNEVTIKTTNKFSIVSIANYESYQDETTSKTTSKTTNNRPTTDQQLTTIKECKEVKNEKKDANLGFLDSLKANKAYIGVDIEREFLKCQTWCAVNKKMLSERRFVNWLNRAEKPVVFTPAKKERLPSPTCTACNGSGKLPDGKTCWCLK